MDREFIAWEMSMWGMGSLVFLFFCLDEEPFRLFEN